MKLLCVRGNSTLVKGSEYEALAIDTRNLNNYKYFRPRITVDINGNNYRTSPTYFTNLDGTPIGEKSWQSPELKKPSAPSGDIHSIKKGDFVICKYSTTILQSGNMYKVDDIRRNDSNLRNPHYIHYIKIEGFNRWVSPYRFRPLDDQEKRSISLSNIFGEQVDIADPKSISKTRKIDRFTDEERNKLLVSFLLASICDTSRNNLSIIDWAIQKKAKGYGLTKDDFKSIMNKKLSSTIKELE